MKLLLESKLGDDICSEITAERIQSFVVVSIKEKKLYKDLNNACYKMTKEQLSDFIGGLLHLQSKLRK